jgi:hypothetical protein
MVVPCAHNILGHPAVSSINDKHDDNHSEPNHDL